MPMSSFVAARRRACSPTAATLPVVASRAIADGSSITSPRPATQMRVLVVPRSIAIRPRKPMVVIPLSEMQYATLV